MSAKLILALVLTAGIVACFVNGQKWMKLDGYDKHTCARYNTEQPDEVFGFMSCEQCCHLVASMDPEILYDERTDSKVCACTARDPIELMDRSCAGVSPTEESCGACCKKRTGKDWDSVKNVFGEEECRCKGPWVEKKHFLSKVNDLLHRTKTN